MNSIAFKLEDAISGRTAMKLAEKARPKVYVFECTNPSCRHREIGGPTTIILVNVKLASGKEKPYIKRPRWCSVCGSHMIKLNPKKFGTPEAKRSLKRSLILKRVSDEVR